MKGLRGRVLSSCALLHGDSFQCVMCELCWLVQVADPERTPAGGNLQPGDGVLPQRAAEEQTLRHFPGRGGVRHKHTRTRVHA